MIRNPLGLTKVDMVLVLALATESQKSWEAPWLWSPYSVSALLLAFDLRKKFQQISTYSRVTMN